MSFKSEFEKQFTEKLTNFETRTDAIVKEALLKGINQNYYKIEKDKILINFNSPVLTCNAIQLSLKRLKLDEIEVVQEFVYDGNSCRGNHYVLKVPLTKPPRCCSDDETGLLQLTGFLVFYTLVYVILLFLGYDFTKRGFSS